MAKLSTAAQFQEIVRKALGGNFGEIVDVSEVHSEAHLRIVRVAVKGKDGDVPVRWFYCHVSDPDGRQVTLAFRVEEKNLETFGRADEHAGAIAAVCGEGGEGREEVTVEKRNRHGPLQGTVAALVKPPADCDWMRRCETNSGSGVLSTCLGLTPVHAKGLAPPSE